MSPPYNAWYLCLLSLLFSHRVGVWGVEDGTLLAQKHIVPDIRHTWQLHSTLLLPLPLAEIHMVEGNPREMMWLTENSIQELTTASHEGYMVPKMVS